jgi:hypothetical protein
MTPEFRDACGIGYRLERRLRSLGVEHPWGINLLDDETLQKEFGPHWARELRRMGQGEEPEFLARHHQRVEQTMKSVGRSITGYKLCQSETETRRILRNLIEETAVKAREQNLAGREVWVALYGRHEYWSDHALLFEHINRPADIYEKVCALLDKREARFPVIKFAVRLGRLRPLEKLPRSLLPEWEKSESVARACDEITRRYGLFAVRPATLLDPRAIIRPEVTGFLGDQQFQLRSSTSWSQE